MALRLGIFWGLMLLFGGLQWIIPSRPIYKGRVKVMISNLLLVGVNNLMILIIPVIPLGAAAVATERGFGLLQWVALPKGVSLVIGFLLLDVVIYWQHRLFHHQDLLWRLHRMHHYDPMLDVTSGLRFHPLEIFISNFIKVIAILLFGVNALTVLIFEISLNGLAMFNHADIRLSEGVERWVSYLLITPAKHTIHHSIKRNEVNSNYGFSVPWWDMLFGSYIKNGTLPQAEIHIGILDTPDAKYITFPGMLIEPFLPRKASAKHKK